MQIYTVYISKTDPNALQNAVFIKEGFSIPAALFQGLWALYNKMWLCAAMLILLNIGLIALENRAIISQNLSTIIQFGIIAYVGFEAGDWYRNNLSKNGFIFFDIVSGKNLSEAQYRFFFSYAKTISKKIGTQQ